MNLVIKKILSLVLVIMCVIPFGAAATAETNKETALTWPVPGHYSVTQEYIDTPERFHNGIDILDNNIAGATVSAAMGGTVKKVFKCTYHHDTSDVSCYGYGTCVIIYGDDGRSYIYAHLLGGSIPSEVYEGAKVAKGAKIGQVGNTGYSYAYHLHFVVADGEDYLHNTFDPLTLTFEEHPDNATALTAAGVKYPVHLESGAEFDIFGTVFSPNNIIFGEVKVLDTAGNKLLGIVIDKKENRFDLSAFAAKMDFASLADGSYRYVVDAADEMGYSVQIDKPFTVGAGETTYDSVDKLYGGHDCDAVEEFSWGDGVITAESSCVAVGVKSYTCKECGNTKTEDIPMVAHDFAEDFTVDVEPSVDSVGYKSRHCRDCDATTDVTEIPKLEAKSSLPDVAGNEWLIHIIICALPILILWRFLAVRLMKSSGLKSSAYHEIGAVLLALFCIYILTLTVCSDKWQLPSIESVNFIPFKVIGYTTTELLDGNYTPFLINFLGNILIFAPLGFLYGLCYRGARVKRAALFGFLCSVTAEAGQLFNERCTDVDDLWMNTLGAVLGFGLYLLVAILLPRPVEKFKVR